MEEREPFKIRKYTGLAPLQFQKTEIDVTKVRRRIEDRLRKDQEAVIRVAAVLKIKVD